jgi:ketosteroid isomerase-like protein
MHPSTATLTRDARTARAIDFFVTLTPAHLANLEQVYAPDAGFIDPFNDVTGQAAIRHIFAHMFETLESPRFEVLDAITEGAQCFLLWNFHFRSPGGHRDTSLHGSSHLRFAADGRIALHRDYWDPARELYEGVPVLGSVLRWLRRRLSAQAGTRS